MASRYSRRTILAATDTLTSMTHAGISRFLLGYGLELRIPGGSIRDRANALATYLLDNPEALFEEANLTDAVVEDLISRALQSQFQYPELNRALQRDGFTIEDGTLRRALPREIDMPAVLDEVHGILQHYGLGVSEGHLDQAIGAHSRGDWAAANGQLRTFMESLVHDIAVALDQGKCTVPPAGEGRWQWLANGVSPPFFLASLNEWKDDGKGFLQGFYKRLHPAGSHPGLSDEEDSTFRLHLVLLIARQLLKRLKDRLG